MKDKAYLYHIYCKVKDRIQREKQVKQSDDGMDCGWIAVDGMETPFV